MNLDDPGADGAGPPNPIEAAHREKVIELGLELKKHQSLKALVRTILQMETYRVPQK